LFEVIMMKNNNLKIENDELGSIGIGAMIVFIALILVAAVASAVIIQTGEKLQQNAQQTGSDTQQEISGKISVSSVFVDISADTYLVFFESAPGSEILTSADIEFQMSCENGGYNYVNDDFGAAEDMDGAAAGTIDPGTSYSIVIDANTGANADCSASGVGINGDVTFWIHAKGGGSTYETLYIFDDSDGALVI
tara:strand:+ start:1259 stop:1840 length:582 start_codon:yes stop_codon:yes gene_type:complete